MTIPDFQSIMLPLLQFDISEHFRLTENDRRALLPSGQQPVIDNRTGWARSYLKNAGLLETPRRSYFRITDLGLEVLQTTPTKINVKFLDQFPQFKEFRSARKVKDDQEELGGAEENSTQTPQELLEYGYRQITSDLAQEILGLVKQCTPRFFEKLVVELLLKMGYGGSLKDAGKAVGQSGDGDTTPRHFRETSVKRLNTSLLLEGIGPL